MNDYISKWSHNYRHYIDPWYGKMRIWFMERGFEPPTKWEFYTHCYHNSKSYYDPNMKKKVPPIILTPAREEELLNHEEKYILSKCE